MRRLSLIGAALASLVVGGGCASSVIDVYSYQAKPLPANTEPLNAINWSIHQIKEVSWTVANPYKASRAKIGVDGRALTATLSSPTGQPMRPLHLTYRQIVGTVQAVTHTEADGLWTVHLFDPYGGEVQLHFLSMLGARVFLDAATILATTQPAS